MTVGGKIIGKVNIEAINSFPMNSFFARIIATVIPTKRENTVDIAATLNDKYNGNQFICDKFISKLSNLFWQFKIIFF